MSGSLTIVGGNSSVAGLVTVPVNIAQGDLGDSVSGLQGIFAALSTGAGTLDYVNNTFTGGATAVSIGANPTILPGVLELTNYDSTGASSSTPPANFSTTVPAGYSYLVVESPGAETINGNGSANFLAVFGNQSSVTFNAFGSGSVVAGGVGDYVGLTSGSWSALATGGDTVNTTAIQSAIATTGDANVVGLLGGSSSVLAGGTGDLIETFNAGATGSITLVGVNDRVLVDGGADTVTAYTGSTGVNAFFNLSGGSLDFINSSGVAATVSGAVSGAIGGSVTVSGGSGGGSYAGGPGGNNSLIGGSGLVTLYGSGSGNILSVNGAGSGGNGNVLSVGNSGTSQLYASSTTTENTFFGGASGQTTMVSAGTGVQNFFVGTGDSESIVGSTTSGAINVYYFDQDSTGSGSDVITNFRLGTDHLFINHVGGLSGVSIAGISANAGAGGGSIVSLSDNTTIKLYGVSFSQQQIATLVGGTSI